MRKRIVFYNTSLRLYKSKPGGIDWPQQGLSSHLGINAAVATPTNVHVVVS